MLGWKCDDDDGTKEMLLMFLTVVWREGEFFVPVSSVVAFIHRGARHALIG